MDITAIAVITAQYTRKSFCCITKTKSSANFISLNREKKREGALRHFNFIKQMRNPRKKLIAEAKSEAGIGLIGQDSVVDSTVLFPLCFGLLVPPDGEYCLRLPVHRTCLPAFRHFCFSRLVPFMAHIQPRKHRKEGASSPTSTTHQHHDFDIPCIFLSRSEPYHVLRTEDYRIWESHVREKEYQRLQTFFKEK